MLCGAGEFSDRIERAHLRRSVLFDDGGVTRRRQRIACAALRRPWSPMVGWERRTDVKAGRADVIVEDKIEAELEKVVLNKVRRRVGWDA